MMLGNGTWSAEVTMFLFLSGFTVFVVLVHISVSFCSLHSISLSFLGCFASANDIFSGTSISVGYKKLLIAEKGIHQNNSYCQFPSSPGKDNWFDS